MWIPFGKPTAAARISGGGAAPSLCGIVKFYQMGRNVLMVADLCGFPQSETGIFALHIHEGSSCDGKAFENTGTHFDPGEEPHPNHAGDLPPLFSCNGKAFLAVLTDRFTVAQILGRTVVIHSGPDDFHSQPAGNAGEKIACGVITRC